MQDKLRNYIEGLFEDAPQTKKTVELKEEMIQNLGDKYNDLFSDGKSPEAAFNIAVAGIGDVSALLRQLEDDAKGGSQESEAMRRKSAMLTAVAVMMYILCVLPLIILSELEVAYADAIGLSFLFIGAAAATGLLIYNSMTKPQYHKEDDTVVEEFKEWQASTQEYKQMRKAISSTLWSIILVLYFVISFSTFAWHITWIIFPVGGAVEALINLFFSIKKDRGERH
ncbi:MAG: permease prefix domain 1-containing protein [Oscillospiraceae bacterium]|nr:permease prefix domain 1-containing protein [Oscillospiraceae bacterium]